MNNRKNNQTPTAMWVTIKRIISYLGRRKFMLFSSVILSLVATFSNLYSAYLIKPITNDYIMTGDIPGLARMLMFLFAVYGAGTIATVITNQTMIRVAQHTIKDIRKDLFEKIQKLPLGYFDSQPHGDIMSLFTNDVDTLQMMLEEGLLQIINNTFMFVGTVILMLFLSPSLFIVTVVMMSFMLYLVKVISVRSRKYFKRQQNELADVNGFIEEMIEGQQIVQTFNRQDKVNESFDKLSEHFRETSTFANTFGSLVMPVMNNVNNINFAITAMIGGIYSISRGFDIGTLLAYLRYTQNFSRPIQMLSVQMNSVFSAVAGAERIFEAMDEVEELDEGQVILVPVEKCQDGTYSEFGGNWHSRTSKTIWAWKVPTENGSKLIRLKGDVRFENVDFGYVDDTLVLKDLNLYAEPGQKIAFVGSTGAGKTTITNLINRFYEINSGTIYFDGIDVRHISKKYLRRSLGMVLQDTELFTGTVRENIRYGRLSATDEEIVEAAKLSNALHFIRQMPEGLDTMLTGAGNNLSEGQRQLLAITRTALAESPVLILDEATSSIDTRTEHLVGAGLDQLMEGNTVFVIAHRLSTIRDANAIMVLEHGEIIERGNHEKLMSNHGRYYELSTGKAELT